MLLAQCRDTTPMGGIALFVSQAAWRSYRNASRLECKVWFGARKEFVVNFWGSLSQKYVVNDWATWFASADSRFVPTEICA